MSDRVSGKVAILLCGILAFVCLPGRAQEGQVGGQPISTVSVGATYLWADQGGGQRSNLNGWYAKPSVNVAKGFAVFASFSNYYGANRKGALNAHGYTLGVSKDVFTRPKFKPIVFAESGDVRVSNAEKIVNELAINAGFSFTVPLQRWVLLAVTPAEWVSVYPKGTLRNDFNAKAGFCFPIGRRRSE
jgi:hypothetical protein